MMVSNRNDLFQGLLFRFHVKFRGSISWHLFPLTVKVARFCNFFLPESSRFLGQNDHGRAQIPTRSVYVQKDSITFPETNMIMEKNRFHMYLLLKTKGDVPARYVSFEGLACLFMYMLFRWINMDPTSWEPNQNKIHYSKDFFFTIENWKGRIFANNDQRFNLTYKNL